MPSTDPMVIDPSTEVGRDEYLLRRVLRAYFTPGMDVCIKEDAFRPRLHGPKVRDPDSTGISLYRAACLADPDAILATVPDDKKPGYGIVRVPVAGLFALGLSVVREDNDAVPGHVVIPELRAERYAADKDATRRLMFQLAELASAGVVRWPEST